MKNYIILLLVCFSTQLTIGQNVETYENILQSFQDNYNKQDVDAIFNMYATELQEEMTKEGVTGFVKGCYEQFGSLKSLTFIQTEEGVVSYMAKFDKSNLEIQLQVDNDRKISTIQFHPIEE